LVLIGLSGGVERVGRDEKDKQGEAVKDHDFFQPSRSAA
jgi:hypothetical protein